MNLQDLCGETVTEVEGCLGCAVVDLETGLPLAMEVARASIVSQDAMELLAAASAEYFRGQMMWQLQLMIAGRDEANFVQEIQTTTEDTYNFMSVAPKRQNTVLVLILDKAANLGLGRISVRQVLRRLSEIEDDANASAPVDPAARRAAPVVMPSAFMHAQAPASAPTASERRTNPTEESARSTHVPYQDVSAADELGADDARHPDANTRPWRGGLGGRPTR